MNTNTLLSFLILFGLSVNAIPILPSKNVTGLLATRNDNEAYNCNPTGYTALTPGNGMINYAGAAEQVRHLPDAACTAGTGPTACMDLVCYYGVGIQVCNNIPTRPYIFPHCSDIADIVTYKIMAAQNCLSAGMGQWQDVDRSFTITVSNCTAALAIGPSGEVRGPW